MSETIFVSYSHKDAEWRDKFSMAIGNGVYQSVFDLWFDERIEAGDDWEGEIETRIEKASIALLLVSPHFIQSNFIANKELPKILNRHKAGGLNIWWVPIEKVPDDILKLADLDPIQAAWPPERPLGGMTQKAVEDALMDIGSKLIRKIRLKQNTNTRLSDALSSKVAEVIDNKTTLGDAFAAGDYSIFYRAKRDIDVAVKALVPSPGREWLGKDFIERANVVRNVANSTAIGISHVIDEKQVQCVVMELVSAPTLQSRLEKDGCLSCLPVADVLAQLARLAGHLHAMNGQPIMGPVHPSHVHYAEQAKKARVSLIPITSETLKSCQEEPTRLMGPNDLTYLSPERYAGLKIDAKTDQYYLALLGLELLQGKPPVVVTAFSGLEQKNEFFDCPRKFFPSLGTESPALSFILAKMLERRPEKRWQNMSELFSALDAIAKGNVPDAVRDRADEEYSTKLSKRPEFFHSFYERLFASSDDIAGLFRRHGIAAEAQSKKLNLAMGSILNFTRNRRTTTLHPQIRSHRALGLRAKHFKLFQDAFLDAVAEAPGTDDYSLEAWRAVLEPALCYMRDEISQRSPKEKISAPLTPSADQQIMLLSESVEPVRSADASSVSRPPSNLS